MLFRSGRAHFERDAFEEVEVHVPARLLFARVQRAEPAAVVTARGNFHLDASRRWQHRVLIFGTDLRDAVDPLGDKCHDP